VTVPPVSARCIDTMSGRLSIFAALMALLLLAAPAGAATSTHTLRVGPITVGPYQVKQNDAELGVPTPKIDGFITRMEADVVDANGSPVPIDRLMLHHIVFANAGSTFGEKKDATCDTFTALDSVTKIPAIAERFYAAGEERAVMDLPAGHGYKVGKADNWAMIWMLMNHRAKTDTAYIQYKVTVDDDPSLTPVKPVWMDVRDCKSDPVYDVPGGGKPGSLHHETETWQAPSNGRIVAGGGHVHGGGRALTLSQPDCGDRVLHTSSPTWGNPDHPFYTVKPVLHEPGPVHMSGFKSAQGFPIGAGQQLKLTSTYDAELPHSRVMGIELVYFAPDANAAPCGALPTDIVHSSSPVAGRTAPPKVTVPLTGLDSRGRAVKISKPPGRTKRLNGNARVRVEDVRFTLPNLSIRRGKTVRWDFKGNLLHDVTLASGPRAFSSPHYAAGGTFKQKLTVPGTYKLFCSLHPVSMTQRVVVR
jgi:plastocyanin